MTLRNQRPTDFTRKEKNPWPGMGGKTNQKLVSILAEVLQGCVAGGVKRHR